MFTKIFNYFENNEIFVGGGVFLAAPCILVKCCEHFRNRMRANVRTRWPVQYPAPTSYLSERIC